MTIEKPKPLNLFGVEPKQTLKQMLEATDRRDKGEAFPSPLNALDPMTLDELVNRIITGSLALNQVPESKDIEKLVNHYWAMREQFNLEQQLGLVNKPQRKTKAQEGTSVEDLFS